MATVMTMRTTWMGQVAERPVRKQRGAPEQAEDPPEVERRSPARTAQGMRGVDRPRTRALGRFFLEVCRIGGHVASARLLALHRKSPPVRLNLCKRGKCSIRAFAAFERFLRRIRRFPERFSPEITNSPGSGAKRQRGQGAASTGAARHFSPSPNSSARSWAGRAFLGLIARVADAAEELAVHHRRQVAALGRERRRLVPHRRLRTPRQGGETPSPQAGRPPRCSRSRAGTRACPNAGCAAAASGGSA